MRKLKIASMLGQQETQEEIGQLLKKDNLKFSEPDCETEIELLTLLEHVPDLDVLLIYYPVITSGMDPLFTQIREIAPKTRIVLIIPQKTHIDCALGEDNPFSIYDVLYEKKWLDLSQVCAAIRKGRLPEIIETADAENDIIETDQSAIEPPNIPTEPENIADETNAHTPPPQITDYLPTPVLPQTKIGVFGLSAGAGVSTLTEKLNQFFGLCSLSSEIVCSKDIHEENPCKNEQFTILDLGVPFRISEDGRFLGLNQSCTPEQITLLKECNFKICMECLEENNPYQEKRVRTFLRNFYFQQFMQNDVILLLNRSPVLHEIPDTINVFARDDPALPYLFCDIFFQ